MSHCVSKAIRRARRARRLANGCVCAWNGCRTRPWGDWRGHSAGGCLLFDQIASPDPIWGSYRDRGYDSLRSGPRGWPRRSLLGSGGVGPALIVVLAGFAVIFVADHFVRPKLIGGATKLPFLWVLLGILGGVESFQLLGLFLGPAIMAALMLLWRQLTTFPADQRDALVISEQDGL